MINLTLNEKLIKAGKTCVRDVAYCVTCLRIVASENISKAIALPLDYITEYDENDVLRLYIPVKSNKPPTTYVDYCKAIDSKIKSNRKEGKPSPYKLAYGLEAHNMLISLIGLFISDCNCGRDNESFAHSLNLTMSEYFDALEKLAYKSDGTLDEKRVKHLQKVKDDLYEKYGEYGQIFRDDLLKMFKIYSLMWQEYDHLRHLFYCYSKYAHTPTCPDTYRTPKEMLQDFIANLPTYTDDSSEDSNESGDEYDYDDDYDYSASFEYDDDYLINDYCDNYDYDEDDVVPLIPHSYYYIEALEYDDRIPYAKSNITSMFLDSMDLEPERIKRFLKNIKDRNFRSLFKRYTRDEDITCLIKNISDFDKDVYELLVRPFLDIENYTAAP